MISLSSSGMAIAIIAEKNELTAIPSYLHEIPMEAPYGSLESRCQAFVSD